MSPTDSVVLVDLLGFVTGAALYGMLLAMVVREPARVRPPGGSRVSGIDALALLTAFLGLFWNVGELAVSLLRGAGILSVSEAVEAFTFVALGFLPAVVVHSAVATGERPRRAAKTVVAAAYTLSAVAGVLHLLTIVEHTVATLGRSSS
jgi:hypothetical protein